MLKYFIRLFQKAGLFFIFLVMNVHVHKIGSSKITRITDA
jgi:hypothetical protein